MPRLFLFLAFVIVVAAPAKAEVIGQASVIDGDTIEIHGDRIRLHGIDAPESSQTCSQRGETWRCGAVAAHALDRLIGERAVRCQETDRDRYGRIVAVCMAGGVDINRWMVANGWAMAYRRYSEDYVSAERQARVHREGIWASEFTPPWEWRSDGTRPGNTGSEGSGAVRDRDCSDFSSWRQAQQFYERFGGPQRDPHRLDADRDGICCERLR
jgi:endonuclease YncB( thermonuclease family)